MVGLGWLSQLICRCFGDTGPKPSMRSGATQALAASSAILPLVTAQSVAFGRGVGGWISRLRTVGG